MRLQISRSTSCISKILCCITSRLCARGTCRHAAHLCMQALGRTGAPINGTRPAKVPFKFDFFLGRSHRMLGTSHYYCTYYKMSKRVKLRFYVFRLIGSCHSSTIRYSITQTIKALSARATVFELCSSELCVSAHQTWPFCRQLSAHHLDDTVRNYNYSHQKHHVLYFTRHFSLLIEPATTACSPELVTKIY